MSYEIVYTSSQAGLAPGDRGFCVVAASKGIPPQTMKYLESLSGYRQPYAIGDPRNPVIYSHVKMSNGESVLSRTCDPGADYSGRSNKLAHIIVLSPNEQPNPGPVSVMMEPSTFLTSWQGEPRILPPKTIHSVSEHSGPCSSWASVTGDAGWAAVLSETALNGNAKDAFIIYPEGTNCLQLLNEALSLLTPKDRWQVTFSTFTLKPGSNQQKCQWRFIQKGQKEERDIPPHSGVLKLDLTTNLGRAPDGELSHLARTGVRSRPEPASSFTMTPQTLERTDTRDAESILPIRQSDESISTPVRGSSNSFKHPTNSNDEYRVKPSTIGGTPPTPLMPSVGDVNWGDPPPFYGSERTQFGRKQSSTALPIMIGAVIALIGLLSFLSGFYFHQNRSKVTASAEEGLNEDIQKTINKLSEEKRNLNLLIDGYITEIEDLKKFVDSHKQELDQNQKDQNKDPNPNSTATDTESPKSSSSEAGKSEPKPNNAIGEQGVSPQPNTSHKDGYPKLTLRFASDKTTVNLTPTNFKSINLNDGKSDIALSYRRGTVSEEGKTDIESKVDRLKVTKQEIKKIDDEWSDDRYYILVEDDKGGRELLYFGTENKLTLTQVAASQNKAASQKEYKSNPLKLPVFQNIEPEFDPNQPAISNEWKIVRFEKKNSDGQVITPETFDSQTLRFETDGKEKDPSNPSSLIPKTAVIELKIENGILTATGKLNLYNKPSNQDIPILKPAEIKLSVIFNGAEVDGKKYQVQYDDLFVKFFP